MAAPATAPDGKKKRHWIENLTWVMIYGGLLTMVLGIAIARADKPLGWIIGVCGAVVAAAGIPLIVARSRMKP